MSSWIPSWWLKEDVNNNKQSVEGGGGGSKPDLFPDKTVKTIMITTVKTRMRVLMVVNAARNVG